MLVRGTGPGTESLPGPDLRRKVSGVFLDREVRFEELEGNLLRRGQQSLPAAMPCDGRRLWPIANNLIQNSGIF